MDDCRALFERIDEKIDQLRDKVSDGMQIVHGLQYQIKQQEAEITLLKADRERLRQGVWEITKELLKNPITTIAAVVAAYQAFKTYGGH